MDTEGSNGSRPRNNNRGKNEQVRVEELRRGPWTPEEDAILKDYVMKNGGGKWNVVPKVCGLNRCGKSCRLRWVNHLRPNLKKGAFSAEEESIVVHLHSIFGNKWASMTSQLPGRTDNEIKNFWNTRLKKRRRANLPIYPTPSEIEEIKNRKKSAQDILNNPSSSILQSSSCTTTLIHSPSHDKFYDMLYTNMPYAPNNNSSQNYTDFNYQNNNNKAFAFTGQHNVGFINNIHSSSISVFSSSPVTQYKSYNLGSNQNPALSGSQTYAQNGHQVVYTTTPQVDIFNHHSNVDYEHNGHQIVCATPPQFDIFNEQLNANDGLLENVVNQAKTLSEKSKNKIEVNQSHDQEYLWDYKIDNELPISLQDLSSHGGQNFVEKKHFHESSSSLPTMGTSSMETNDVDYNFFNTPGNLPVTSGSMPVWYDRAGWVTPFNDGQATMGNRQEPFNSSNSMAMATSQAVMDNSSHRNIMPGVHQAFDGNENGNGNISGIQW